ncbi:MAG TPA: hypothetical protein PLA44_14285 [Propionibacteriaceae bacterium]|nr:hypothetical protein [Propionibacteriaceae bacterium]
MAHITGSTPSTSGTTGGEIVRWFDRRGLTLLLAGTPYARSTSERATPVLIGWFLLVMLVALPMSTTLAWWVALGMALAIVVVTWLASNVVRRRPLLGPIQKIGWLESAAFVIGPPLMITLATSTDEFAGEEIDPLSFKVLTAVIVALLQVVALLVILGLERLGIVTLSRWLSRSLGRSLSQTGSTLATSLPVSLGVVFFFFLNPGVWGSIGTLTITPFLAVISVLLLLAALFIARQQHLGLAELVHFETAEELREALSDTPLADLSDGPDESALEVPASCPLTRRQRFYVRQIAMLSQLMVGLIIAAAVFLLFLVIGYLAVDPATAQVWTRSAPNVLLRYEGAGHTYLISSAHLQVAGFLACFVAFNFTLASATDARLRHTAKEAAFQVIRQACAVRLVLLRQRA